MCSQMNFTPRIPEELVSYLLSYQENHHKSCTEDDTVCQDNSTVMNPEDSDRYSFASIDRNDSSDDYESEHHTQLHQLKRKRKTRRKKRNSCCTNPYDDQIGIHSDPSDVHCSNEDSESVISSNTDYDSEVEVFTEEQLSLIESISHDVNGTSILSSEFQCTTSRNDHKTSHALNTEISINTEQENLQSKLYEASHDVSSLRQTNDTDNAESDNFYGASQDQHLSDVFPKFTPIYCQSNDTRDDQPIQDSVTVQNIESGNQHTDSKEQNDVVEDKIMGESGNEHTDSKLQNDVVEDESLEESGNQHTDSKEQNDILEDESVVESGKEDKDNRQENTIIEVASIEESGNKDADSKQQNNGIEDESLIESGNEGNVLLSCDTSTDSQWHVTDNVCSTPEDNVIPSQEACDTIHYILKYVDDEDVDTAIVNMLYSPYSYDHCAVHVKESSFSLLTVDDQQIGSIPPQPIKLLEVTIGDATQDQVLEPRPFLPPQRQSDNSVPTTKTSTSTNSDSKKNSKGSPKNKPKTTPISSTKSSNKRKQRSYMTEAKKQRLLSKHIKNENNNADVVIQDVGASDSVPTYDLDDNLEHNATDVLSNQDFAENNNADVVIQDVGARDSVPTYDLDDNLEHNATDVLSNQDFAENNNADVVIQEKDPVKSCKNLKSHPPKTQKKMKKPQDKVKKARQKELAGKDDFIDNGVEEEANSSQNQESHNVKKSSRRTLKHFSASEECYDVEYEVLLKEKQELQKNTKELKTLYKRRTEDKVKKARQKELAGKDDFINNGVEEEANSSQNQESHNVKKSSRRTLKHFSASEECYDVEYEVLLKEKQDLQNNTKELKTLYKRRTEDGEKDVSGNVLSKKRKKTACSKAKPALEYNAKNNNDEISQEKDCKKNSQLEKETDSALLLQSKKKLEKSTSELKSLHRKRKKEEKDVPVNVPSSDKNCGSTNIIQQGSDDVSLQKERRKKAKSSSTDKQKYVNSVVNAGLRKDLENNYSIDATIQDHVHMINTEITEEENNVSLLENKQKAGNDKEKYLEEKLKQLEQENVEQLKNNTSILHYMDVFTDEIKSLKSYLQKLEQKGKEQGIFIQDLEHEVQHLKTSQQHLETLPSPCYSDRQDATVKSIDTDS